jgi:transposase
MVGETLRCVVGIDVAKASHTVCALTAPAGEILLKSTAITASAEGYAQVCAWLSDWSGGESSSVLIGMESTGSLWEPLYDALTLAGYAVLVLNPHQTAAWATSMGWRAKTDGIDAYTLARGLLAGWARASTVPDETVQALRALTRARRDLVQSQSAARQRLHDELVLVFPELAGNLPDRTDLGTPAILRLLGTYSSAQALARAPLDTISQVLGEASGQRWGATEALALQTLAQRSAASTRAVAARGVVVRTLALHLLDLQVRLHELTVAIAELLRDDADGRRLQQIPGIGPQHAATIRAELGDIVRFQRVDQVIAYAGLEPRVHNSGRFVGQTHLSKRGPGALRHALYLATLVAVRFAPEWRWRYQRLLERGRAKKEALTILSRALLKVIFHLLRTGASYDPAVLNPSHLGG